MTSHLKFQHPDGFSLVLMLMFFLDVVPAEAGVFTWAEVFEVMPVGSHFHPRDDDDGDGYVDEDDADGGGGCGDD